jgi:hypothetical protein
MRYQNAHAELNARRPVYDRQHDTEYSLLVEFLAFDETNIIESARKNGEIDRFERSSRDRNRGRDI